jgi:hypothetical protein
MNNLSIYSVFGSMGPAVYVLVFLDLILKGMALYKSAKRDQKVWFVFLLIVNSLGILPIIYLIVNKDIRLTGSVKPVKRGAKKTVKRTSRR